MTEYIIVQLYTFLSFVKYLQCNSPAIDKCFVVAVASILVTSQFDFRCVNDLWSINVQDGEDASIQTPPTRATLNTTLNRNCAQCLATRSDAEEETHCIRKQT